MLSLTKIILFLFVLASLASGFGFSLTKAISIHRRIREIFLSFQGGLSKMYRIYKKTVHSDEGDFSILVKSGTF